MRLEEAASIDDLAILAKRRLPKFAFDFLDGGAGDEAGCRRNRASLQTILLKPHYGLGLDPQTETSLFGQTYRQPFGIAPVGLGNLAWPGADLCLAQLAQAHGIPYVLSTVSTTAIETVTAAAAHRVWFQLYLLRQDEINRDLLRRAWAAGIRVLVLTIDIVASGTRRRDVRNRFTIPFRIGPKLLADLMLHSGWSLNTLRAGRPSFANLTPYAKGSTQALAEFITSQVRTDLNWEDVRRLRDLWQGTLVVKGVLTPEDAGAARQAGADGIWVSNHGGRQLDAAPASIDALAAVRAACGPTLPVLLDSGIRSGEDIVRAGLRGADFVFSGRSFYYGMAAGGAAGGARAVTLLAEDLKRVLVQIGCPSFRDLDEKFLWSQPASGKDDYTAFPVGCG